MKGRILRWPSIPVRGNWEWTLALVVLVAVVVAAVMGGFSDGGDSVLASWWDGP